LRIEGNFVVDNKTLFIGIPYFGDTTKADSALTVTVGQIAKFADDTAALIAAKDSVAAWDNGVFAADVGDSINARMVKAVTGNTETGIAVTYVPADSTMDFVAEVTQAELDAVCDDSTALIAAKDSVLAWDNGVLARQANIRDTIIADTAVFLASLTRLGKLTDDSTALIAAKDSVAAWDNNSTFLLKAGGDVDSIKVDTLIVDDKFTVGTKRLTGNQHFRFTISNPNAVYAKDAEVCIVPVTEAALTITRIDVTCDADPATEVEYAINFADAFIGLANAAAIDDTATVGGVTTLTGSGAGFDDATVAAGKCIYLLFNAEPIAAIKQMSVDITYDFDE
jgi:hypothetical protein